MWGECLWGAFRACGPCVAAAFTALLAMPRPHLYPALLQQSPPGASDFKEVEDLSYLGEPKEQEGISGPGADPSGVWFPVRTAWCHGWWCWVTLGPGAALVGLTSPLLLRRMILSVLTGLLFGSDGYYVALAWTSSALMYFIVSAGWSLPSPPLGRLWNTCPLLAQP